MTTAVEAETRAALTRVGRLRIAIEVALEHAGVPKVHWTDGVEGRPAPPEQATTDVYLGGGCQQVLVMVEPAAAEADPPRWAPRRRRFEWFAMRARVTPAIESLEVNRNIALARQSAYAAIHFQAMAWAILLTRVEDNHGEMEYVEDRIVRRWFERASERPGLVGLAFRALSGAAMRITREVVSADPIGNGAVNGSVHAREAAP